NTPTRPSTARHTGRRWTPTRLTARRRSAAPRSGRATIQSMARSARPRPTPSIAVNVPRRWAGARGTGGEVRRGSAVVARSPPRRAGRDLHLRLAVLGSGGLVAGEGGIDRPDQVVGVEGADEEPV